MHLKNNFMTAISRNSVVKRGSVQIEIKPALNIAEQPLWKTLRQLSSRNRKGVASMRQRTVVLFLALFIVVPTWAGTLKGIVLENEIGGPPMAGVEITASGANPTLTGSDGQFQLIFSDKSFGNTVQVIVHKLGYVVVNDIQLEQVLPANPNEKILKILICKPLNREEMARRYYRLKSLEIIETSYRRLLTENQFNLSRIAQLQEERDRAISSAERAAEELAKVKIGPTSNLYKQAMRFFLDGQIDQALKILDEERLHHDLDIAQQMKDEADHEIGQIAQSWVLKARLFTIQFKFDDAERAYREAIESAPNDFDVNFAFAYFSDELSRHTLAKQIYKHCFEIAQQNRNMAAIAQTLNGLGIVYRSQDQMQEARQAFEEALRIRRELAERIPSIFLPAVANTLNNLGILYSAQDQTEEARQFFSEAQKIRRELNGTDYDSDIFSPGIESPQAYEEALKIRRELARKNPDLFLPNVAQTLNNLGTLYSAQNRIEEARRTFDDALTIYRRLARTNPNIFLPDVAHMLNNLGFLHRDQNQIEEAHQAFSEALTLYRELAGKNPDIYLPHVAMTLSNLGVLYRDQNHIEEAHHVLDEAMDIYQTLATKDPEQFRLRIDKVKNLLDGLPR